MACPLGDFHVDFATVQRSGGKLYLFVTIDRTSRHAFGVLYRKVGKVAASALPRDLIAAATYRLHIVLIDLARVWQRPNSPCHANLLHVSGFAWNAYSASAGGMDVTPL